MLIIGHRGAPTEALENSLASFHTALEGGAQRIECDIQLSQDNIPYIIHDETLDRTSNGTGLVSAHSSDDLKNVILANGQAIPTLAKVLELFLHKVELNLELKGNHPHLIESTIRSLPPMSQRPHDIIISSFSTEILEKIQCLFPAEKKALLWEKNFVPREVMEVMTRCACKIFHPEANSVNEEMMDFAKINQWQIYPWISLDDENDKEVIWHRLQQLDIDGLCTNYPRELAAWLRKK